MKIFRIIENNNFRKIYIPFPIFDIYYFQWKKWTTTGIHDHADKGCIMFLLKGQLKEILYNKELKPVNTNLYISPNLSFINNKKGFHSIQTLKESSSIHFYYPKNHITKYYK